MKKEMSFVEMAMLSALLWIAHFLRTPEGSAVLDNVIDQVAAAIDPDGDGTPGTPTAPTAPTRSSRVVVAPGLRAKQSSVPTDDPYNG